MTNNRDFKKKTIYLGSGTSSLLSTPQIYLVTLLNGPTHKTKLYTNVVKISFTCTRYNTKMLLTHCCIDNLKVVYPLPFSLNTLY